MHKMWQSASHTLGQAWTCSTEDKQMPKMWHYVVLPFQTGVHGTRTRRMLLPTPVKGIPGQHCVGLQRSRLPAITVQLGQVCQEGRKGLDWQRNKGWDPALERWNKHTGEGTSTALRYWKLLGKGQHISLTLQVRQAIKFLSLACGSNLN